MNLPIEQYYHVKDLKTFDNVLNTEPKANNKDPEPYMYLGNVKTNPNIKGLKQGDMITMVKADKVKDGDLCRITDLNGVQLYGKIRWFKADEIIISNDVTAETMETKDIKEIYTITGKVVFDV